jgi:hypothetical protein
MGSLTEAVETICVFLPTSSAPLLSSQTHGSLHLTRQRMDSWTVCGVRPLSAASSVHNEWDKADGSSRGKSPLLHIASAMFRCRIPLFFGLGFS